jgi:hypothetical protein
VTGKQPLSILSPSACFVIERVPSKGYQVTRAEGQFDDEWKKHALDLLDKLGQPDPNGPEEYYQWIGPIAPSGAYVGVSVKLRPNGEARYYQAWFQTAKPKTRPKRTIGLLIFVMLVTFGAGFGAGVLAYLKFFAPRVSTSPDPISRNGGSPETSKVDPSAKDGPPDISLAKLKKELESSREVRDKLKKYLSQKEFTEGTSKPVVDERRSVKLIADLDKTPPVPESISLNNVEVAKLLRLLETLEKIDAELAQKSEGR